jgi:hypothetical protein
MKQIYKVLYPIGFEIHEVAADFPTVLPFVEVKPLEGLENNQSQFFNFSEGKWEEAVTQDYSKKLGLLENLHEGLKTENANLSETTENLNKKLEDQETELTNTQLGLAEVYGIVMGGTE